MLHTLCFSLQNAVYFIMLPILVHVLFTFYIHDVLKFKCKTPVPKVKNYLHGKRCKGNCPILARGTLNQLLLHRAIRLSATVGQRFKRQRFPCGGLTCKPTTCYTCAVSTWNSNCLYFRMFFILFLKLRCVKI
jgi:hypothetical protein